MSFSWNMKERAVEGLVVEEGQTDPPPRKHESQKAQSY